MGASESIGDLVRLEEVMKGYAAGDKTFKAVNSVSTVIAAVPGIRYVNRMDIAKTVTGGRFG